MINLREKGFVETDSVIVSDLVALANVEKRGGVDTKVISCKSDEIVVDGVYENISDRYAVAGEVIVYIKNSTVVDKTTVLTVEINKFGTSGDIKKDDHFRTVIITDYNDSDLILTSWEFTDTMGSVTGSLFPVELGSGTVTMKSDLSLWSPHSLNQRYKVRPRKSIAYIFKGVNDLRVLKFTTVVQKVRFNTRGKSDPNRIVLDIKTKLSQWYDKDVVINKQLKGTTPKEFFKMIFNLNDNEVYYAEGVDENSFLTINNLHTKEYTTISELLKAYCQNGVRFCFDRFEKVKIFGDFKVDNIKSLKTFEYNITNSMMTENELMIYNTINTQSYQRQTMYNFDDLKRKYVIFSKVKNNVVNSDKFIKLQENGDYTSDTISIKDEELHKSVQLKDYVLFKRTKEPLLEFYARVISLEKDYTVVVAPMLYDKDFKLLNLGKYSYLYKIMNNNSCPMDLYYVKSELPMIFKYTRNIKGEEKDSSLMLPLLPKVDGVSKYQVETNVTFGCASNLKVGKYTGIVEEVDKIYGIWDNSKLLYNMELTQYSNTNYPPISALSNRVEERLIKSQSPILNYTHFDNSNLMIEIDRPKDNSCDAVVKMSNTGTVNSGIDLYVGKELSRLGNQILEVEELEPFKLGDVLIANKPDDLTPQEETEFDEVISDIKWRIIAKESQVSDDGVRKHYIFLDSPFAKRQKQGVVYEFTKFPNWSIVYLQELYFRGNPVIEFTQDITGLSKGTNIEGDTSRDIYGEKKYDIDSKQLNKDNLRMLMGYVLDNFQATTVDTTKFNVPISIFNGIDIELLDVIAVKDPTYTKIEESIHWVVVGVKSKSNTNEVELTLLNVNSTNTKPYKIDIKDVIQYEPVDIPQYDHAGGEGNAEENNDGTGGTDDDPTLGKFWLAEVDPQKFRAKVEKFEGNYIYFKDFAGTESEEYKSKLFPESEFGVTIKGETIFVQSDMNYRAFIKKRRVYDTDKAVIAPEDDVTFLVTTTYVDIDGTFYSRKMMVGDGDSYLSVHPIKGVKIKGDFQVGENDKNSNNDLWQSLQNNRTFYQNDTPTDTVEYKIKKGDIWYDTNDSNHVYRFNGTVWESCRDGSIVTEQSQTFIQPEEPKSTEGRPLKDNDTWYDSDDGYKPYIYKNGKWVNVSDKTLQGAIDKVQEDVNKIDSELSDRANDNKLTPDEKQATLKEWEQIKAEYPIYLSESLKFGVSTVLYKEAYDNLDIYITPILLNMNTTTDISGEVYRQTFLRYYNRRQELLNNINNAIKEKADKAQEDATQALGNAKVFYQTEEPKTGMKENDIWFDTDDGNHPYVYRGNKWVSARDTSILLESGNRIYYQNTEPQGTSQKPLKEGDIWIDIDEGNLQYIYHENRWVDIRDKKVTEALNNARVFFQNEQPTSIVGGYQLKDGDIWYDTNDGNHVHVYSEGKWKSAQDSLIDEALKSSRVFRQPNQPSSSEIVKKGDLWYKTDDNNHLFIYDGTKWVDGRDTSYLTEGGNRVYFQNNQPNGTSEKPLIKNDMWIDTDDNNHPYVYNGSQWLSSRDGSILNANNAIYFQNDAPQSTSGKPLREGDLWYDTNDGNKPYIYKNSRWVEATDKNLENKVNNALANARIFYQPTAPTSTTSYTLKENDLWYDTDDNNHPYIYRGSSWLSARDKAFETEGGNKVYFQDEEPSIQGTIKDGDMWFDTNDNNKLYVLKTIEGVKKWVLANDANDKIEQGRIVINGNTTFNGDATIVSQGKDETTIIKGGSITFTRGGKPITVIRNMRMGEIETDSKGKGILSFPDFKNMSLMLSIKSFAIGQNVRSLGCYANLINSAENKYQCFLYGTEAGLGNGVEWETDSKPMHNSYSIDCISLNVSRIHIVAPPVTASRYHYTGGFPTLEQTMTYVPTVNIKVYIVTPNETKLIKNISNYPFEKRILSQKVTEIPPEPGSSIDSWTRVYLTSAETRLNASIPINISETSFNITNKTVRVDIEFVNKIYGNDRGHDGYKGTYTNNVNVKVDGSYNLENLQNLTGHGTLFYIAMEN